MSRDLAITDPNDVLQPLIDAVAARLEEDETWFGPACCPVLTESKSDFLNQLDNALDGRTGMAAVVGIPSLGGGEHEDHVIATVVIQVYEHTLHNQGDTGTKKTARGTALRAYLAVRGLEVEGWGRLSGPKSRPFLNQIQSGVQLGFEVVLECAAVLTFDD